MKQFILIGMEIMHSKHVAAVIGAAAVVAGLAAGGCGKRGADCYLNGLCGDGGAGGSGGASSSSASGTGGTGDLARIARVIRVRPT